MRNFAKRSIKEYNLFRRFFQRLVCAWTYGLYLSIRYRIRVEGDIKAIKNKKFIVASNHISGADPFILCGKLKRPLAFMAKKELFDKFFSRMLMNFCGAFSVNRQKLEVSTIKTAISIKDTSWTLSLFPQGTRDKTDDLTKVNKGFASIAKATKSDILPVAIQKQKTNVFWPFSEKITVKIGDIIPYSDDIDDMIAQWVDAVNELLNPNLAPA